MPKIKLEGVEYNYSFLSDSCKGLVVKVRQIDTALVEKENMLVVLTRAKNSYIAELQAEIIGAKAGFDFGE
jgi:hypothetical protein